MAHKSARGVTKDDQKHRKYIDERLLQNLFLKQQKGETAKKVKGITDDVQKCGGETKLNNYEEKL